MSISDDEYVTDMFIEWYLLCVVVCVYVCVVVYCVYWLVGGLSCCVQETWIWMELLETDVLEVWCRVMDV